MTAISKAWVVIVDASVDPDSPLDTTLMTAIRDDLVHLREWLGASYTAGAVQNHNHDGSNSELLEIGSNALRNGSFESGTTGWTTTNYTGGSNAAQTTGAIHGKKCWAATSTVLANGGAYALSNEFVSISAGEVVNVAAKLDASVANVSSRIGINWYDGSDALISSSAVVDYADTPTASTLVYGAAVAPTGARSFKVKVTGGVPAAGSATGTVYFDGVFARTGLSLPYAAGTKYLPVMRVASGEVGGSMFEDTTGAWVEAFNARVMVGGTYRAVWTQRTSSGGQPSHAKIYINGVSAGTQRDSASTTYAAVATEDFTLFAGDTVQLFVQSYTGGSTGGVSIFRIGISAMNTLPAIPYVQSLAIGQR